MAKMNATYEELIATAAEYFDEEKIANPNYVANTDDYINLIDKIFRTYTIDGDVVDEYPELEKESFEFGQTMEEYFANFIQPYDFDPTGTNNMVPEWPTWMKSVYHSKQGVKTWETTQSNALYRLAFTNAADYGNALGMVIKRLNDSKILWQTLTKKELLGFVAKKVIESQTEATTFAVGTAYSGGTYLKDAETATAYGITYRDIAAGGTSTWAQLVEAGDIVVLDLVTTLAKPVDTETGEAFIKSVKTVGMRINHTLQGDTLMGNIRPNVPAGSAMFYIDDSIPPSIQVDTLAGAFNPDLLGYDVRSKNTHGFGKTGDALNVYAILCDLRGIGAHPYDESADYDRNGKGRFTKYYLNKGYLFAISTFTFLHVWKSA